MPGQLDDLDSVCNVQSIVQLKQTAWGQDIIFKTCWVEHVECSIVVMLQHRALSLRGCRLACRRPGCWPPGRDSWSLIGRDTWAELSWTSPTVPEMGQPTGGMFTTLLNKTAILGTVLRIAAAAPRALLRRGGAMTRYVGLLNRACKKPSRSFHCAQSLTTKLPAGYDICSVVPISYLLTMFRHPFIIVS